MPVVFTASSPGPDTFYIASNSLSRKWRNGLAAWMGVCLATLLYVFATALGLSALFAQAPVLYEIVKWGGVIYLAYLGFQFSKQAIFNNNPIVVKRKEIDSIKKIFWKGVLVSALNPKLSLFVTALLP